MTAGVRRKGLVIGVSVALVLIAIFSVRLDWSEFRRTIAEVRWGWIAAGFTTLLLTITVRGVRWLAVAGGRAPTLAAYWSATVVGYAGNALYPGRAGEVLRVAALHHAIRVPPGEVLASAFMDRMADVVALTLATLYVLAFVARDSLGRGVVVSVVAVAAAFLCAFVGMATLGSRLHPIVARGSARLPNRWSERVPRWYLQAVATCRGLAAPKRLASAVVLTAFAFFLDYCALWLMLRAFDWSLPVQAAMTVGVFLAIGTLLPAAPGYVGIYQVACVLALKWYAISETAALAYSVVAQGATLLAIF
ncbi:MAG TPA: lysylphosphatidylglycerol synthase transmembrane domain-containing protein, partial [Steroidobacteraceae bacterium]